MRIGVDVRALSEDRVTGVQVYIKHLLESLFAIDKDNQYILFTNSFKHLSKPNLDLPRNAKLVTTHYPNKFFTLSQSWLGFPKVDKLLGGLDLFFSPHWRSVALSSEVPLVMTVHDLSYEVVPEYFNFRQRLWHKIMRYRKFLTQADGLIAVSESTKQDLVEIYSIAPEKVEVIYSGVNKEKSNPTTDLLNELQRDEYFLHLATFEPRKNIQNLVYAFEKYAKKGNKKLVLAGSRGWKIDLEIPENLKHRVLVYNNISDAEKSVLLERAFALVFVSYYEGFGFPVLEAMNAGTPVIASYGSSLYEVCRDAALYVNPFRPGQIAGAFMLLENDLNLRNRLIEKGQMNLQHFDWQNSAKQTLDFFKTVYERQNEKN